MKKKIKIGYVGLGRRGYGILSQCIIEMADVEVVTVCDTREEEFQRILDLFKEKGKPLPKTTCKFDDVINDPEIEAVMLMTGWQGRAELAIKSMEAGKYTAIEVGAAFDLSECYALVDAYEKTGTPLMMLENICYGRNEMMALNVVKQGLFGEIVHCAGGYMHYLPKVELFLEPDNLTKHYRLKSYMLRNLEQYPTHELGPLSKILNLNRGNKMLTLSSFSSKSAGIKQYAADTFGKDSPYATMDYKQGDIITTVITCAGGETIHLCLDTTLPRAYYSRNFTVRGTKGMFSEEGKVLYFPDMGEKVRDNLEEMYEKYDHPLQKEYVAAGESGGHGGADWLVCRAFFESVRNGTNTPIDAYDTAAWMAIGPLSEMSIAQGGAPVSVPDFTRGKWMNREPIIESKYCLDKVCEDASVKIYPEG